MVIQNKNKATDAGIIPVDWNVLTIREAFDIFNTLRFPISEDIRKKMPGIYPYYGPTKIQDYINEYRVEGEYALIGEDGDHFLKWREMPMTQLARGKFNVNNHAHLIKGREGITITQWFYHYFKNKDISQFLTRQGASRYKLSKGTLVNIPCAIPPTLQEQAAIATALSDTDALISSLEKLIAKKRNIKQGAMQELLTPKGGWEMRRLGDISEIYTGKKNNQDKVDGGNYPFFVRSQNIERINTYSYDGEAILIPGEGGIGNIFHYFNGRFDFHQRVYKISDFREGYSVKYIYRFMCENFGRHAMQNSVKATVDSLRLPTLQNFKVLIPPTIGDQIKISAILGDFDSEIALLESKQKKYQEIKSGMMQNLLTGKIRLL
ncbi:restriction endonuclease subunit S [Parachryseolinea silvisoli]|uniref:restriction endonuclease subunit S n=1 Tax=Parachryseolinea silvisoli TaxID=2873601 RepID=UPI002265B26A|nr:restriction endonuclease subunit S [Parachryseolinea silvisoli]MCD9017515.1 restriction endonuclease subunit S [Parachryseolinea silvisoli]